MTSGWVKEEYSRAMTLAQRKNPPLSIVAALLREAELPGFLENRRGVDFRDPTIYAGRVAELVWGITGQKPTHVIDLDSDAAPLFLGERIPSPAPLPAGSHMPMGRNELFVGRDAQLRELAELRSALE